MFKRIGSDPELFPGSGTLKKSELDPDPGKNRTGFTTLKSINQMQILAYFVQRT